jgi:uncharacterized membrane protein
MKLFAYLFWFVIIVVVVIVVVVTVGEIQFWMDGSDINKEGVWKWNSTGER